MMKKTKVGIVVVAITFLVAAIAPAISLAQEDYQSPTDKATTSVQQKLEAAREAAKQRLEEARAKTQAVRENVKTRLEANKLKACQNRERAIKNIMSRIDNRGTKHIALLTKLTDRVKNFYTEKGLSVANYDALLADIEAKKADAQAAVEAVKSAKVEFSCDGEDPKGAAAVFKDLMQDQITALQAYHKAVRNLIVAVKSSQSQGGSQQ